MARDRKIRKATFPANFMGAKADLPGGRKRGLPGDGASPVNEGSRTSGALLLQNIESLVQLVVRLVRLAFSVLIIVVLRGGDDDVRGDRFVLNLLAQGSRVLRHREDQGSAVGQLHGLLYRAFAEGAIAHDVGPFVVEYRSGDNFAGS